MSLAHINQWRSQDRGVGGARFFFSILPEGKTLRIMFFIDVLI